MNEYHFYDILSGFTGRPWSGLRSFTDEAVKMTVPSVKWQVFTDDLKKLVLIAPLRGANVVQKTKRKSQILENQRFAICMYPEPGRDF